MQKSKTLYFGIFALLLCAIVFSVLIFKDSATLISTTHLEKITQNSLPNNAKIKGEYLYFDINGQSYKIAKDAIDLKQFAQKIPLEIKQESGFITDLIINIFAIFLVVMLLFLFLVLFNRTKLQQSLTQETKKTPNYQQQAKMIANEAFMLHNIKPIHSNLTFDDVAGIDEAKEELKEIVDYLKFPKKYQDFGIKLPRGVLLVGPPGVGKTLIAKALAGEAKVPFFYQSGASFVQIYAGMGAKRVHDLFTKAKLNVPAIIFIDEIDAVGKARGGMRNDERETTLNQLLTEMDKKCDFDYEEVARLCIGFSGAAIASLINEAALCAIKRDSKIIQKEDILNVRDKVMIGIRKKLSFSEKEKEILAYYQAAKAFSAYWFEVPFEKITLMSDGLKQLDKEFLSKNELENQIKIYLSGIAALELLYSEHYSHSKNDLNEAKNLAYKMVETYGMGEFLLGREEDIVKILENCKNERFNFFKNYRNHLEKIQKQLLINERLEYNEIGSLIHGEF